MNSGLYALATTQREGQAALPYVEDVARAAVRQMRGRLVNRAGLDFPVRYPASKVLTLRKLLDEPSYREATIYAVFRIRKTIPPGVVLLEGRLVDRFIGLMLGEEDPSADLGRNITELELKVADRMLKDLLAGVSSALVGSSETDIKLERMGCHRKILDGLPMDQVMLSVPFEIGEAEAPFGNMIVAVPTQAGPEFMGTPSSRPMRERVETGRILQKALPVQVEVVAEFARILLTVGRLRELKEGDILPLGSSPCACLRINGHKVMDVEAGQTGGHHSVRVLKKLQ